MNLDLCFCKVADGADACFAIYQSAYPSYDSFVIFEIKQAWRFFRSKKKSMARLTAFIAIVGIASGVASLIIAQSLARGFQEEMRDKILANTAQITIFRNDGGAIKDYLQVSNEIQKLGNIRSVSPTTYESALIIGPKSTSYAILRVVQDQAANSGDTIEISIGAELAEKTGLGIGEAAEILVSDGNGAKNSIVRVMKTFRTGLYDYDSSWITLSENHFAKIFNRQSFSPTVLSVSLSDIYEANETSRQIRGILTEDFKVMDWQEANKPLFAALSLEKKVTFAIISLIIIIAVLNITTALALLVSERRLDIAMLRTCGAAQGSILRIFLFEGLFLGISGITLGVTIGLILCTTANYFKIIRFDAAVYLLEFIPLRPSWIDIVLIICVSLLLTLLATLYPAFRASKIKPSENLRMG